MIYIFEDGRTCYDETYLSDFGNALHIAVAELPEAPPIEGKIGYPYANMETGKINFRYVDVALPQPSQADIEEQIEALKAQLTATDYQIIKCSECQLAGVDLPYDIAALHAQRQALRDQINVLESTGDTDNNH